jgi:ribonuclease PH
MARPVPNGDYGYCSKIFLRKSTTKDLLTIPPVRHACGPSTFGWQPSSLSYNARMQRSDGRAPDQIRPVNFELNIAPHATGSVLVAMGNTRIICGVTIEEVVPRWMKDQGVSGGWLTAEYSMLPYSTTTRKQRDIAKGRLDGRSTEIQRLIGRSLRSVFDLEKLGPRTMWIDCDVLQADGGTRTAAITGASVAVTLACQKLLEEKKIMSSPMLKLIAAVSAGIVEGSALVDLNYEEDKAASVDFNLVATQDGKFVEIQGSGEEATFTQAQLDEMLTLARSAIAQLIVSQRNVIDRLA